MSFDPTRPPAVLPADIDISAAAVFLWNPSTLRFDWASPAGARFWSAQGSSDLVARSHAPDEPTPRELDRLWRMAESLVAPGVQRRFETTAVFWPEGVARPVRCAARRITLSSGEGALLVEILGEDARASVSRWRDIFLATPAPLAIFDADGVLLDQNAEAARLFPDDADDALDARFVDAEEARRAMQLALANGAYSQTVQLMLRSGPQVRRLRLARVAAPEDGAPAVLSLSLDPLPEIDAAHAASALDSAEFGLSVIEMSGTDASLVHANPAFDALLEMLQGPDDDEARTSVLPASLLSTIGPIAEAMEQEAASTPRSTDIIVPAGPASPVPGPWLKATLQRLSAGRFAMSLSDLGPERRALLRLKIANEQTAAALDALGVGLGVIDAKGRLDALSPTAESLLDAEPGALAGVSLDTLMPRSDARRLLEYLSLGPVVAGRSLESGVETSLRRSGSDESGEPGALPVRLGVAPRSRLSPTRRRIAFHRADDLRGRHSAGAGGGDARAVELAHALRTRLTSVQGFAELVLEESEKPASALADIYLADIMTAAQECVALVDQHLGGQAAPSETPVPQPGPATAALAPILRSAVMRRDDLLGRSEKDRSRLDTGAADQLRIAARPSQVREICDRMLAAIEADAEPGLISVSLTAPQAGLALLTAEAPGAPVDPGDLSFRLLSDDVEAIDATIESDGSARRIVILFKTL